MVWDQFCYECPECGRVFEREEPFEEERPGRTPAPPEYLKTALRKCKIVEKFSLDEIAFLGNVVAQFQAKAGKSVNYPAFCTIISKRRLLNRGPAKKKSWKRLHSTSQHPLRFGGAQNGRSTPGWRTTALFLLQTQPQFLFQIDGVPCRRVPPLPLFPRNGVESLHHFFVGGVFAFLRIFAVFFISV